MSELEERLAREAAEAYRRAVPETQEARQRLRRTLGEAPQPRRRGAFIGWLFERREFSASPMLAALAVVVLVALGGALARWPGWANRFSTRPQAQALTATDSQRVVRFELVAPRARTVALVGDFNGWAPGASPMRRAGDTWALTLPVSSGRHVYAFLVDDRSWVSDPAAPLAPEDGFGFRKSVIVVEGPRAPGIRGT